MSANFSLISFIRPSLLVQFIFLINNRVDIEKNLLKFSFELSMALNILGAFQLSEQQSRFCRRYLLYPFVSGILYGIGELSARWYFGSRYLLPLYQQINSLK
eukprot:NODE_25_length_35605_cov_0.353461.p22 type:complete len:102 gc:universal NODE_25_length_35605_cov_0.353461:5706-6011(+)